jgi:hypothetical protein
MRTDRKTTPPAFSIASECAATTSRNEVAAPARSPPAVSQKREYFGMWPETFGNFGLPLANSGGWRPPAELEKPAVGGHFSHY